MEQSAEHLDRLRRPSNEEAAQADVIITTARVPGRRAPILITRAMVEAMKPGAVIVDMAAGSGGNCELTDPDHRDGRRGHDTRTRSIGMRFRSFHIDPHLQQLHGIPAALAGGTMRPE